MKSIKEKANEYANEYLFSPLPQRAPNIHFEAGANYVLDVIEEFMKHNLVCSSNLKRLIEQLKSNQ